MTLDRIKTERVDATLVKVLIYTSRGINAYLVYQNADNQPIEVHRVYYSVGRRCQRRLYGRFDGRVPRVVAPVLDAFVRHLDGERASA